MLNVYSYDALVGRTGPPERVRKYRSHCLDSQCHQCRDNTGLLALLTGSAYTPSFDKNFGRIPVNGNTMPDQSNNISILVSL